MPLKTVNLAELANQIKKPFDLLEAAQVDELGIYLYASHGRIGWHRHVDEDELFLVLNGMVSFDSERGSQSLHVGELLLMPKGVGHRSSSLWRSTVLLVRPRVLASVQNGQRQLFALPAESKLPKKTLSRVAAAVLPDFAPHKLARLGAYQVDLMRGLGVSLSLIHI
jgi:mannose-6-phosphate isomerase-like protein (cupin superfamily)